MLRVNFPTPAMPDPRGRAPSASEVREFAHGAQRSRRISGVNSSRIGSNLCSNFYYTNFLHFLRFCVVNFTTHFSYPPFRSILYFILFFIYIFCSKIYYT